MLATQDARYILLLAAVWNIGQVAMLDPVILWSVKLDMLYKKAVRHEEALTNQVPAVAVTLGGQALFNHTGCKRCVGG